MEHFYKIKTDEISKDICIDLMRKDYLYYDSELDCFELTEKGNSIMFEFLQNLANLG